MDNKESGDRTPRLIDLRKVSKITSLGKTSIYLLIQRGELYPAKLGRKTVFSEAEVLKWVEKKLASRGAESMKITHPFAATEWRVIDSEAYADLTYSARSLLVLITRQLKKNNNGHLQATFSYMKRFGFSENTLSRAIHELIIHGMIYCTRSGGFHQGAAQYAVTWLSITNKNGLYLDGFLSCAWRYWMPTEKKVSPPKLRRHNRNSGKRTPSITPKIEAHTTAKTEDTVLIPIRSKKDEPFVRI